MTNAMIIMLEQEKLAAEGILTYTGKMLRGINPAGEEVEFPEVEPIHTYLKWKELGYQVKKGETAFIKFPIWKYTKKKKTETEEEAQERGYCFMKVSAFFTRKQVERIEK